MAWKMLRMHRKERIYEEKSESENMALVQSHTCYVRPHRSLRASRIRLYLPRATARFTRAFARMLENEAQSSSFSYSSCPLPTAQYSSSFYSSVHHQATITFHSITQSPPSPRSTLLCASCSPTPHLLPLLLPPLSANRSETVAAACVSSSCYAAPLLSDNRRQIAAAASCLFLLIRCRLCCLLLTDAATTRALLFPFLNLQGKNLNHGEVADEHCRRGGGG
ncbi:hypothetical protein PIB30_064580 [Stylosanthes scabra]|uniref:Uncharacterized protein n=1 Tax=Stylosanthes scabra TaxID=79078 RepID=A0ABU6UP07_9FABA|nr:hypothetical protein [Stylosanthes scabra]